MQESYTEIIFIFVSGITSATFCGMLHMAQCRVSKLGLAWFTTFSYCLVVEVVVMFSPPIWGILYHNFLVSTSSGILYMGEEGIHICPIS
jgi:hypothetical protein